jgi:hypothetical protein
MVVEQHLLQAINADGRDEVVLLVKSGVSLDITVRCWRIAVFLNFENDTFCWLEQKMAGGEERNPLKDAISHPLILRELLRFGAPVNAKVCTT